MRSTALQVFRSFHKLNGRHILSRQQVDMMPSVPLQTHYRRQHSDMTLTLVPLHTRPHLINPCIKILYAEWPHSKAHRLNQLEKSCNGLPYSVVLVGNLDQSTERVLGHVRLVLIRNIPDGIYLEDGLIVKDLRAQGFNKQLLDRTETHCKSKGFTKTILDTSLATSKGLLKLGYKYRNWKVVTIGSGMLAVFEEQPMDLPCPGWECFYRKPNDMVIKSRVRASIMQSQFTDVHVAEEVKKEEEEEEQEKRNPPSWSFDYFNKNYVWLQKEF